MHQVFIWLALVAGVGFVSNLASFRYIYFTFDLKMSLFYILALDSAFASLMSLLGTITFSYLALNDQPDPWSCSIALMTSTGIALIQPSLSFIISLIRFKRMTLNCPNGWKPESLLIRMTQISLICAFTYFTTMTIFNSILGLNVSYSYIFCMHLKAEPVNLLLLFILVILPVLLVITATSLMDIKCLLFIKNHQTNQERFQISLRASIISTLITVPYFILASAQGNLMGQLSIEANTFLSLFTNYLVVIIRNPLISTCAFRVNSSIQKQLDAQTDREKRRKVEMEHAIKAREERKNGRFGLKQSILNQGSVH